MHWNTALVRLTALFFLVTCSSLGFSQETHCKKTVYLTFDTGNMSVAQTIADILNRQNIKATFFLANEKTSRGDFSLDESYDQMLKFIASEEVNKLTIWQLENLFAFMVYFENERENVLEDITLNNVKKRIEQMRSHDNQLGLKEKNSRKGNF